MGKRGPKPGHGGRPIEYTDEYHRVKRQLQREYLTRQRLLAEHGQPTVTRLMAWPEKEFVNPKEIRK